MNLSGTIPVMFAGNIDLIFMLYSVYTLTVCTLTCVRMFQARMTIKSP